jgi:hypothetical protein
MFVTTTPPGDATGAVVVYYQSNTGQMGFQLDDALLGGFLEGAWILDRKEMAFAPPKPTSCRASDCRPNEHDARVGCHLFTGLGSAIPL